MLDKFMLAEDCFLVQGAKRGALYDLKSGEVYSIDEESRQFLSLCEEGIMIEDILKKPYFHVRREKVMEYLQEVETSNLGSFLKKDQVIKKILLKRPPHKPDFIWLELTNSCNLRCVHCYNNSEATSPQKQLGFKDWLRIIREAYELGCRRLQFIGGEPFLLGDNLIKLADYAIKTGYKFVEIFTNGTSMSEEQIDFILRNKIAVAISVYGSTPLIHDEVTTKKGSFNKTLSNLKRLVEGKAKVRVAVIGMEANCDHISETISFLKEIGVNQIGYDVVRPIGRGHSDVGEKITNHRQISEPKFPICTQDTFQKMLYGHNCFSKELCVSYDGKVIPCIMERSIELGNTTKQSMGEIWNGDKAKQVRGLNKDTLEICKDCEYRYACFDCRPKARVNGSKQNFYTKPFYCRYDPHAGEWKI